MARFALDGPAELCQELRLVPTRAQAALLEQLRLAEGVHDIGPGPAEHPGDAHRAVLVAVLWRVLLVPGSSAVLVGPSDGPDEPFGDFGRVSMSFLEHVTMKQDVGLAAMSRLARWNHLEFTGHPSWGIRYVPSLPGCVDPQVRMCSTAVVLGAGTPDPALREAEEALLPVADKPGGLLIRLWGS
jgi:hypothetical protein